MINDSKVLSNHFPKGVILEAYTYSLVCIKNYMNIILESHFIKKFDYKIS